MFQTRSILTALTKDRREVFRSREECRFLIATVDYFRYMLGYGLYGYVVMPDHIHLLIRPSQKADISTIMKFIKASFSRRYNRKRGRKGSVWQPRFSNQIMVDMEQVRAKIESMHDNPVRAGLVEEAGDYEYSSYDEWMSDGESLLISKDL